jgi:hypothetical protein
VRSGAHAHASQEGDIELGVDPAVVVSAGWGDAALSFEESEVLRSYPELPGGFADM